MAGLTSENAPVVSAVCGHLVPGIVGRWRPVGVLQERQLPLVHVGDDVGEPVRLGLRETQPQASALHGMWRSVGVGAGFGVRAVFAYDLPQRHQTLLQQRRRMVVAEEWQEIERRLERAAVEDVDADHRVLDHAVQPGPTRLRDLVDADLARAVGDLAACEIA
ncbi:Uncharacterised protein [Mycobacteroides abscessus subsp. abscessus]|nr:Uncharacterised protein [Mycobacteroides abscessus subsp. abscessus]